MTYFRSFGQKSKNNFVRLFLFKREQEKFLLKFTDLYHRRTSLHIYFSLLQDCAWSYPRERFREYILKCSAINEFSLCTLNIIVPYIWQVHKYFQSYFWTKHYHHIRNLVVTVIHSLEKFKSDTFIQNIMVVFQKLEEITTTSKFWINKCEGKTSTSKFWIQKFEGKSITKKNT